MYLPCRICGAAAYVEDETEEPLCRPHVESFTPKMDEQEKVDEVARLLLMRAHRAVSQAIGRHFDVMMAGIADEVRQASRDLHLPEDLQDVSWGDVAAQVYCREQNGE